MIKLNLGSGKDIRTGWDNLDLLPQEESVIQCDLEKGKLPYKTNTVTRIDAIDLLEHIHNLIPLMNECHRVLIKPTAEDANTGEMYIEVPCFPSDASIADPTHVRFFIPETFKYFTDYTDATEMYGITQWKIADEQNDNSRIRILLRP